MTDLPGYIIRREGRKFLDLEPLDDDFSVIIPAEVVSATSMLYVHVPFCRSLCPFCCFNRYPYDAESAERYFEDLRKELDLYLQRGFDFTSVYFGGGTPAIDMDKLCSFIEYLKERSGIREISLETTPAELDEDSIRRLKDAGIKRLSVGVQSFDEKVVKSMGRKSLPSAEIKRRLQLACGQFDTLNIDFVFNFPDQTIEQFSSDIAVFKEMNLDQATFYPLMPSPHKMDALERRFRKVDFRREREFYDIIIRELYREGYAASTPWCFSRGGQLIDEYIIKHDNYIGIGAGSVGMTGCEFRVNSFSLERYHGMIDAGRFPVVRRRVLSDKERLRYHLLTGLFGMKLNMQDPGRRLNSDIGRALRAELFFLKFRGIIESRGVDELYVTGKGMYSVSVMMREFFAALNALREYCIENKL